MILKADYFPLFFWIWMCSLPDNMELIGFAPAVNGILAAWLVCPLLCPVPLSSIL